MAPKSRRTWFDVQLAILTIAMAAVLGLWNLFAGPDREKALKEAAEGLANQAEPVAAPALQPVQAPAVLVPALGEKIVLGGTAPQTQVFIQRGGGGGPVTSTSSS